MAKFTYAELKESCENGNLVLRLSDRSSHSPLLALDKRNAFLATSEQFYPSMSNADWQQYQDLWADWTHLHEPVVQGIIDHVAHGYYKTHKASLWISGTTSPAWAIWEIARRLATQSQDRVELSVINRWYSPNYRGSKSFIVHAHQVIDHWDKTGDLAYVCSPRSMSRALNFSAASNEVLFLGRVFEKDRLETTYWTREAKPILLPETFYRAKKHWRGTWLNNLIWDPRTDSFAEAEAKITARLNQILTSRR